MMLQKDDIFSFEEDVRKVKPGKILLSEPFGRDMYFKRSVILIVEHNHAGTIGFSINKSISAPIKNIFKEFPIAPKNFTLGGPVELDSLHFIHTLGDQIHDSVQVTPEIYWGGDFEQLRFLLNHGKISDNQIRFFIGYCGWAVNQLSEEISKNMWVVSNISSKEIFSPDENIWFKVIERLGQKFKPWLNVPEVPELN